MDARIRGRIKSFRGAVVPGLNWPRIGGNGGIFGPLGPDQPTGQEAEGASGGDTLMYLGCFGNSDNQLAAIRGEMP
jgi:hypothetical protein